MVVLSERECLVCSKFGLADGIVARQYSARQKAKTTAIVNVAFPTVFNNQRW
jgi:hypothetical protein